MLTTRLSCGAAWNRLRSVTRDISIALDEAVPRIRHGWAPSDTWNLDQHLCRTLGEMLDHLATHGYGWPQSDEFPTYPDWVMALEGTASMLHAYDPMDPESVTNAKRALGWVTEHLPDLND